jgi:DNA polymerase III subunit delta'
MFSRFWGNSHVVAALERVVSHERIPQTMLFAGMEGLGKATLARRFASRLLDRAELIEQDDLSLPHNQAVIAGRERWPADKRNEDPLLFASHPDFVTFAPDGPLRQISIHQMRLLKERAPFKPLRGRWRVFLIDHLDRANEQAANSLLKTLEEPPEHLIIIATAENAFDLLPTIRSRAVPFYFTPLSPETMHSFVRARGLDHPDERIMLANGSPGRTVSLDLAVYDKRRRAMLALLRVAAGEAPWDEWIPHAEVISRTKSDRLEWYVEALYPLLRDLLVLRETGGEIRNEDLRRDLAPLAEKVTFDWIRRAVSKADELIDLVRRNIQKTIALDSLIVELRSKAQPA